MNVSDSEIVASILDKHEYIRTTEAGEADIILLNTCAIRKNAEERVRNRLVHFRGYKKKKDALIVLLGCMADRVREALEEDVEILDVIAGPDSYRDLPRLIEESSHGVLSFNTLLSEEETYADIEPVRYHSNGVSAFLSVMRGCENHCSYCVVPSTRGLERSRNPESIVREVETIIQQGFREITLLGQNVNSYRFGPNGSETDFSSLLKNIATLFPDLRIRFATSHPKDLSDNLLEVIAAHPNICRSIHLPAQSGSNRILELMNRKYTRETYLKRVAAIRNLIPECTLTTDLITGFCGETEEDHQATLSLMKEAGFDAAYMFKYSERPHTYAANHLQDDVPGEVKERRLKEIITLQHKLSLASNEKEIGQTREVLVEGLSKRSAEHYTGRTSQNKMVIFPRTAGEPGELVQVTIHRVTSATLIGEPPQELVC